MRIGMFTDAYTPDVNGVVSSIVTLQQELIKMGNEVFIITTKPVGKEEGSDDHLLRLSGIELKNLYGYVLTSPYHFFALEKIRQMRLDVIHVHTEFSVGIFARIVSKNLKIPLVSTYHTMYEDYTHYVNIFDSKTVEKVAKHATRSLSRLYGDACTMLIVPSEKTKKRMEFYGVRKDIKVIPTGLEISQFDPNNTSKEKIAGLRKGLGYKPNDFVLAYIGRVAEEKSIDLIIKAFQNIKNDQKPIYLVVVGDGSELNKLKELTKELDLSDYVQFTGRIPHDEIPAYYHMSDAFASASLTETQGITYIEAFASGLAVFARPDEVLDGLVDEGITGFLFKTPAQLATKLEKYAEYSVQQRKEIHDEAIKRAQNYDCGLFGRRVLAVYQEAIDIYGKDYIISKVKMTDDLVTLTLTNNEQAYKVTVTLDQYSSGRYHKGLRISKDEMTVLLEEEKYALAYSACLKKLASKDRTVKEIYDYLTNETELEIKDINKIVTILEEHGYLNDYRYMMTQIESMQVMKYGHNRIVKTLVKKGIVQDEIEKVLDQENENLEIQRGTKWAERTASLIHDRSVKAKKSEMYRRLAYQGYDQQDSEIIMSKLDFSEDQAKEKELLEKVADKAYKRYAKKYEGSKLRNTTFRFLISQGFQYNDVYEVLSQMEVKDE